MNNSSANHLLKLLEEPSSNTMLFLVSDNPEQVLPTIASRTQPVKLTRIDEESMTDILTAKYKFSESDTRNIVRLANGDYIKTLEIINSTEENDFNYAKFVNIMRYCWSRDYLAIHKWVEEMAGIGRERLIHFFLYSSRMVRENFLSNTKNPELVYLTESEKAFSTKFHPFINGRNIIRLYDEINEATTDIERNGYIKIILFDFSLQVIKLIRK
jgi:DNA polymerase-3 subunit delta'